MNFNDFLNEQALTEAAEMDRFADHLREEIERLMNAYLDKFEAGLSKIVDVTNVKVERKFTGGLDFSHCFIEFDYSGYNTRGNLSHSGNSVHLHMMSPTANESLPSSVSFSTLEKNLKKAAKKLST